MKVDSRRLVTDLSALIQIPSFTECDSIAEHLLRRLRADGHRDVHRDEAGNVILRLGRGRPGLLLNAHVDTVPPGDYEGDPFSGKVVAGRILGRGSSDDKAGVAALLEIARHLARAELNQLVTIALTVWEESTGLGENGSYHVARTAEATRCIVLESTMSASGRSMGVNVGCKGIMNLTVDVRGKACHSGSPEKGDNALYRAARVIQAFEKAFDPKLLNRRTYTVGRKTVELGELATLTEADARQGINVIPALVRLSANCRLLPDSDGSDIRRRMDAFVRSMPRGWVTWKTGRTILGHVCTDAEFIEVGRQAVRETGLRPTSEIISGRLDTTIFQREGGIQSMEMGPGTLGVAHTKNEYVNVRNLTTGTEAVLRTVQRIVSP